MNKRRTMIYAGIVFAIAVLFILIAKSFGFWSLLTAFVLAVVLGIGLDRIFSKKETEKSTQAPASPPNKTAERLESLIQLNLTLRRDSNRDDEIVGLVESVIDALNVLVPKLNSEHPSSDLTFQINRVVDEYLLTTVVNFLKLSTASRANQKEALMASLADVQARVQELTSRIDHLDEVKFDVEAQMLSTIVNN